MTPQIYDGQPYWVYKDPLSLRYYRFNREEHFILQQFKKKVTLGQLREAHYEAFKGELLTNSEVGLFISSLMSKNVLIMTRPDRDEVLYGTAKKTRRKKFFGQLTNFLFFKFPLHDPDKMFNAVIPHIRFIWTQGFLLFYLAMMALAMLLIVHRWHDFTYMFNEQFFTIYNAPMVFVAFWLVKCIHEFGHGLTCKNYGGEVHEIGFLILVFAPFLYCDITDSWTFRSKAHRFLTTAGGIMVELFIAAVAAVVWFFTESPGFIHAFSHNIVIICSISTVMFNANPLLKFDGYYMLMDMIEVPNLRQRATTMMKNLFVRYFLGGTPNEMPEEHRFSFIFPLYAISAFLYRWFIMFMIMYGIYYLFDKMHLAFLGQFLVIVCGVTMLLIPLYKGGQMITKQREALGISNIRLIVILALIVTGIGIGIFWPFPQHVTLNFILEPTRMQWLRTEVPGELRWKEEVCQGTRWFPGNTALARLDNPELRYKAEKLEYEIKSVQSQLDSYRDTGQVSMIEQLKDQLETLEANQERFTKKLEKLEITMPFSGQILSDEQIIKSHQNHFVEAGTPLMLLGDVSEMTAKVWVPEKVLSRIFQSNNKKEPVAEMMLYAFSKDKFKGKVVPMERGDSKSPSLYPEVNMGEFGEKLALSNKVGGEVLTEYDAATGQERPVEAVYEVTIDIDQDMLPISAKPYMSGRVHINCGDFTLYQWGKDSLLRFVSLEMWL